MARFSTPKLFSVTFGIPTEKLQELDALDPSLAPASQERFSALAVFGSLAVMCSACWCGPMTAGPDGFR
jgi:hypothetical protein